ncbi:P-loop containing nucleoside triphosphate hydrolase protein [Mycena chlorophos]|uniref:P-loop containing nucleoside triphosphate hydrolase protein n=1 Tax=Mycena chlorophos TaxID=658473 RepID=A0A8H6WAS2_MYCCL|nr:P-loop containing nucleoside triphosphate hydrolase protein [Mycena chlorophos]
MVLRAGLTGRSLLFPTMTPADTASLGLVGLTVLYDVASRLRTSKHPWRIWSPLRNFLTLRDLEETAGEPTRSFLLKTVCLVALSASQSALFLGCFVAALVSGHASLEWFLLSSAWGYTALRIALHPPITPPYVSAAFAFVQFLAPLIQLTLELVDTQPDFEATAFYAVRILLPAAFLYVLGTLPMQSVPPAQNVAGPTEVPSVFKTCPEDNVTLWQWATFSFVEPMFDVANKGTLNDTDVWSLSPYFKHKNLFNKYLEYRANHPSHSLIRFLLASNSLDLILDVTLELWSAIVGFVPAYALQEILAELANPTPESRAKAYYWTLVVLLAHLSFAQKDLIKGWHTRRCYERTRGQLFCTLHYKSLVRQDMSGKATAKNGDETDNANLGKIVNLMQGDSYAVAQRFWEFSALFASPVRLIIALTFLYNILGWSALSGVVVVLLAYVVNYPLARYNIYITRRSWKARDYRMERVNELLQNVRFLKFFGWEYHWSDTASKARDTELGWRVKEAVVDTVISFIWTWIPSATALSSFLCYTLLAGERLTVSKAFTSLALFSQLQEPMTALPGQFFAMLNAYVSMQRIEAFLLEDEVPKWASTLKTEEEERPSSMDIGFESAVFEWQVPSETSPTAARFQLGPLDVIFPKGKLTLVSGATGSGKTALLSALLGGKFSSGQISLDKSGHQVAYCAQNPWLEHATIRDNIVFGASFGFDAARYEAVISACALVHDLKIFDAGDMTEIGERGVTLSARVILLDDPLAAVDMHTATHIVENCLTGSFARDRTIILVTHHISLCLPVAHYIVELDGGRVLHQGTVKTLEETGILREVVETEDQPFSEEETPVDEAQADAEAPKEERARTDGKLIEAEARAEGRVSIRTYLAYIRAAGVVSWLFTFLLMLLIRGINIANQVFLAKWGEAYQEDVIVSFFKKMYTTALPWDGLPSPNENVRPWLMVYLEISLLGAFSVFVYIGLGYYASLQASRSLFLSLLRRLTRAPARFFDVTPIGRILNRFTTDINTIDGALQNSARACLSGVLNFVASFCVILFVIPRFAPFALFIAWLYIRLAPRFIRASRDLRRLESISLSPAFAGFDELLRGITHVRAFGMEQRYQDRFYARVDKFQSFDHVYWLVSGWLRWRYDCLGSLVVFATTIFALWARVTNGLAAIVIVQAGIFAEASRQLVRVAAQLELDFNSVERVIEYLDVPQEAPAIIKESRPPAYWPSDSGSLVVEDLEIKYAPELPSALRRVSFTINPSEKIGVVGRTGSGKSTLALSLLRMVEPVRGRILVDGVDISKIGLEDLRTKITIVSQDVSLFSGTIRSNLDPLGLNTDRECLDVLERCHLTPLLKHQGSSVLDMPVSSGSLSAGERQLLALSRAILRRTNVIIMDEATSQIDSHLDDQIQKTIREELSGAIVITIAHRLRTIMDYDRILVLHDGELVEFERARTGLAWTSPSMSVALRLVVVVVCLGLVLAHPLNDARDLAAIFGADPFDDSTPPSTTDPAVEAVPVPRPPRLPPKTKDPDSEGLFDDILTIAGKRPKNTNSASTLSAGTSSQLLSSLTTFATPDTQPSTVSSITTPVLNAVSPTSTRSATQDASDNTVAMQWKIIGITTAGIVLVAGCLLCFVYLNFDSMLACVGKKRRRDSGSENLVPDWAKGEWESKIATEDGHRYPTLASLEKNASPAPPKSTLPALDPLAHSLVPTRPPTVYFQAQQQQQEQLDPHPLDPLFRRPSASRRA